MAAPILANASWAAFLAGLVGVLVGLIIGKHSLADPGARQLAEMAEVRRQELTQTDATRMKSLATALEEYAVDNNGKYPAKLDDLKPPYLSAAVTIIPASDPATQYTYENPPSDPAFGLYDIKDNGMFDPSLLKLHQGTTGHVCTPQTCKYIVYAQAIGMIGLP